MTRLFGPLPVRGIWNAVGLERGQFLGILALSVALFLFVGGPLWRHLHEPHLSRVVVSYAVIPVAVAAALHRNGAGRVGTLVGGTLAVAALKLILTAGLVLALGVAGVR